MSIVLGEGHTHDHQILGGAGDLLGGLVVVGTIGGGS